MSRRLAARARALALSFGLAVAPACSSPEQELAERLAAGRAHQEAGRDREAIQAFRAALNLDPQNAELNLEIARLKEQVGDFKDAAFYYGEARRLDESLTEAMLSEARLLSGTEPVHARETVEAVLEREPENLDARLLAAGIQLELGDLDGAQAHVDAAVAAHPERGEAHRAVARVHGARVEAELMAGGLADPQQVQAALDAYDQAASYLEPSVAASALFERARIVARTNPRAAGAAFERALELAREAGNRAVAEEASRQTLRFATASGDRAATRRALERHVELLPGDLSAWSALAGASEATEPGGSEAVFERLLAVRAEDARAHELVAFYRARTGDLEGAARVLEQAAANGVQPPRMLGRLATLLGEAGDGAGAAAIVQRLTSDYPDAPETRIAQARLELLADRPRRALALAEPVAEGSEDRDVWQLVGAARLRLGDLDGALAASERALDLSSEFWPPAWRLHAAVLHQRRDWEGTLQSLGRLVEEGAGLTAAERLMRAQALYGTGQPAEGRRVLLRLAQGPQPFTPAVVSLVRRSPPEVGRRLLAQALVKLPDDPLLRVEEVRHALREERNERALSLAESLGDATTLAERELLRADALFRLERWAEAEEAALRAFDAEPARGEAPGLLAEIYARRDRLHEAIRFWKQRDAEKPLGVQGRVLLAHLYTRTDDLARAVQELERTVREAPLPGPKNDLAYLLARSGRDLDRALELAQEARREIGAAAPVADTLGYVYLRKGLLEPAIAQFEDALEISRREGRVLPIYLYHLGTALRRSGRASEAVAALEEAVGMQGDFEERADARAELERARAEVASG